MDKNKSFVSFVVYLYNDEEGIEDFLDSICAYIKKVFENYEIICVDDGSTDGTVSKIKNYVTEDNSITIVEMGYFQGMELSMNAGIDLSIGDFVYEFDSIDITYNLDVIFEVFQECELGNDIVLACPMKNRSWESSVFYYLYNKISKTNYKIQTDEFRILSRRAVNRVRSMSKVLPYRKAVYSNCGLVLSCFYFESIRKSERKRNSEYRLGVAIDAFVLYTDIAYKLATFFAIFMLCLTIGISIFALVIRMMGIPIAGWTSMVIILCAAFFGMSAILSIITKYTELILKAVFANQKYIVKSVERIVG